MLYTLQAMLYISSRRILFQLTSSRGIYSPFGSGYGHHDFLHMRTYMEEKFSRAFSEEL